jgi:hypothetical protein
MQPKYLNQKTTRIFNTLTENLDNPGDAKTFDAHGYTENWNGGIMAAHIENIGNWNNGFPLYSIAHYYKQNGDMMKDPDMVFVKHPLGKVFPISFEQSSAGIYQESVWYDDGFKMKAKQQKDHATFANTWMENIKEQQEL